MSQADDDGCVPFFGCRRSPRMRARLLSLLAVALCGASCVPTTCLNRVFGFPGTAPRVETVASFSLYARPVEVSIESAGGGRIGLDDLFAGGAYMRVDAAGGMTIWRWDWMPRSCPRVPPAVVAKVVRSWQPLLHHPISQRPIFQAMADPWTGRDDWRPDGPLLTFSIGPPSGQHVAFHWDGQMRLPPALDAAVIETLEMFCSHSRAAERSLRKDLPPQVAGRLDCRRR
jgi:hypothetical protein